MAKLKEVRLYGTTSAGGALTVNGTHPVFGRLYAVRWIDGAFDDGVDAVISTQTHDAAATLLTLTDANNDAWYYPRDLVHDATGGALTGTSGGDREMYLLIGTPRVTVDEGGNATSGAITLILEE